ncbi:ABC transporter substrate-binding protein [Promicromonospora thailandica]|uniref:Multiple sugar transport system substrate-binding protein n=1 Tax=Promicromonospora thailandica TaxID=765201 RepID=A0A9X2GEU7_9MICO|nr:extracellular solute-binding protein [Promicromonospora thailandica]MCP2267246.1 multiple sugar transport system substrate-binding protein [Promicromonospora thailandica]BFF17444.1 sugar ABC transporter substrate-binding protein [Promicromonospora thailandica]
MARGTTSAHRRTLAALAATGVAATALAGCGASPGENLAAAADVSPEAVTAALEEGGDLLVWAWEPTLEQVVTSFEAEYPNVDVELANVGTGNDHYVVLQNAISAGSGVPDVAQVEYYALPQFSISGSLADLAPFGASGLDGTYSPGTWNAVTDGDAVYGLPMDSGPMALFYNAKTFEEAGAKVPATWDEFVEAARVIHAHDSETHILADNGDAGFVTSMIWQAGGHPFRVDGTSVTVDLADEGSTRFAAMWQQLVDEHLVADIPQWSDEWFQRLGDGTLAALVTGAWMPANLESGAAPAAGDWRVAPMPQWTAGVNETAENGGSSLAVTEASRKKALAYGFLQYANAGPGVQVRLDHGNFPATTADLTDPEFLAEEPEYFGGQKINEVLSASATGVVEGWQYLPYQVYANSVFPDTVGQAYTRSTSLADGLVAWEQAMVTYGRNQGFTVAE